MPSGAPPAMQFSPLQFAQPSTTTADAMKGLSKNLTAAGKGIADYKNQPPQQAVAPGTAVQTPGGGQIMVGGPQGPAPFPGGALPGTPYSNQAGPVAPPPPGVAPPGPPPGAPPPAAPQAPAPTPMVPNQPPGGAMVGGQPGAGQPPTGAPNTGIGAMMQNMNPMQRQAILAAISGGAGGGAVPGAALSGMNALGGAGMIPSAGGGLGGM